MPTSCPAASSDYELTDHTKTRRRLGELQGIDPMILVLSRGGFCPKDHQQHLELAANYPKIRVAYAQIVTSPPTTASKPTSSRLGPTTRCTTRTSKPTTRGP